MENLLNTSNETIERPMLKEEKEMKRSVIPILIAIVFLLSILGPALYVSPAFAVDPAGWYTTTYGVLDSDYYELYPFEESSVDFGFSKFGELIGIPAGADQNVQANWIGMAYGTRDPFCPADTIPMTSWINGWYINIEYIDPALTGAAKDRNLFAYAMFADGFAWGGDWQYATAPAGEPHGGRKTNGACTTEDLKILYDGPREFVAQSVTHISDKEGAVTWPVVDLTITMIFNKVKKEVILLKDVKITIPKMHIWGKLNVQLSNREEYDLGASPGYASYAHFYEQNGTCCYGPDWHMYENLFRERYEHHEGNGTKKIFLLDSWNDPTKLPYLPQVARPMAPDFIKIWIDGVFQDPSKYTVDWTNAKVTFAVAPGLLADIEIHYKYMFKEGEVDDDDIPTWDHKYDIAQVIASDGLYLAWTAMWPSVSDYTVDGILRYLDPLIEIAEADMSTEPKQSPLIIGEWDFNMDHATRQMFRGVEVKGIANRHNGDDVQWVPGSNVIDIEAWYQLDEIFMPWDLYSAVHKKTTRWVDFYTVTQLDWEAALAGTDLEIALDHTPVLYASTWEEYCSFSERVQWGGVLKYPLRSVYTTYHYELSVLSSGVGYVTIPYTKVPAVGTKIKILYSTETEYTNYDYVLFSNDWINVTRASVASVLYEDSDSFTDYLGAFHEFWIPLDDARFYITNTTVLEDGASCTLSGTMDWYCEDIKVFKEDEAHIKVYWQSSWEDETAANGINILFDHFELDWNITPPAGMDLHIDWAHLDMDYIITVVYNATWDRYNVSASFNVNGVGLRDDQLYTCHIPGRWEWGIVGRDAESVDSAGLSLVSAAFKNKQIEYGLAGEDMYDPVIANQMPWVMRNFTKDNTKQDYYYNKAGALPEDKRTALQDDWCSTWPITTSNMIGVGGPIANLLAYYGNDFTDAFFGLEDYTDYAPWEGKIIAKTCWNGTQKGYASSNTVGYAVISTYKDINGTVLFLIWGHWGRDTYYVTKWFHEEGIFQLQDAPRCLTSIIVEIKYSSTTEGYKPYSYTIVECLGTISETLWTHGYAKGGIHDP